MAFFRATCVYVHNHQLLSRSLARSLGIMLGCAWLGPHGKTSLKEKPTGPGFMMRKDLDKKVDPASVKKHMCY